MKLSDSEEINQVMAHLCLYLSNEAKSLQFSRTHQYRWEGFSYMLALGHLSVPDLHFFS